MKIGEDIILVVVAIRVAKAGFKFRVKGGTNFLKSLQIVFSFDVCIESSSDTSISLTFSFHIRQSFN